MSFKRILIAGSRGFTDYQAAKEYIDRLLSEIRNDSGIVIISGGATGADRLGERYARENGFRIEKYLPDWRTYGKRAGILRNEKMVEMSDMVICFWDGASKGTRSTLEFARKLGKPLEIILVNNATTPIF